MHTYEEFWRPRTACQYPALHERPGRSQKWANRQYSVNLEMAKAVYSNVWCSHPNRFRCVHVQCCNFLIHILLHNIGVETFHRFFFFKIVSLMHLSMSSRRGGGGVRRGIERDFDIFPKITVKFSTPGQKCEVKYNWISSPQEMIWGHRHVQKFKYTYSRDSKIIQMPYPRAKAIDQIPTLCPASSLAAWHWQVYSILV